VAGDDVLGVTDLTLDEPNTSDREDVARWINTVRKRPYRKDVSEATPRFDARKRGYQSNL